MSPNKQWGKKGKKKESVERDGGKKWEDWDEEAGDLRRRD